MHSLGLNQVKPYVLLVTFRCDRNEGMIHLYLKVPCCHHSGYYSPRGRLRRLKSGMNHLGFAQLGIAGLRGCKAQGRSGVVWALGFGLEAGLTIFGGGFGGSRLL